MVASEADANAGVTGKIATAGAKRGTPTERAGATVCWRAVI
jgi:hypothetical protein